MMRMNELVELRECIYRRTSRMQVIVIREYSSGISTKDLENLLGEMQKITQNPGYGKKKPESSDAQQWGGREQKQNDAASVQKLPEESPVQTGKELSYDPYQAAKRTHAAFLVRQKEPYILRSESLAEYSYRLEKVTMIGDFLKEHEKEFGVDAFNESEFEAHWKNYSIFHNAMMNQVELLRKGEYQDAETLAGIMIKVFEDSTSNFIRRVYDRLLKLYGNEKRFRLHEQLVQVFAEYHGSIGIMTYNDTEIGKEMTEEEMTYYTQNGISTSDPQMRDVIVSVLSPRYSLQYADDNNTICSKSIKGEVNVFF